MGMVHKILAKDWQPNHTGKSNYFISLSSSPDLQVTALSSELCPSGAMLIGGVFKRFLTIAFTSCFREQGTHTSPWYSHIKALFVQKIKETKPLQFSTLVLWSALK